MRSTIKHLFIITILFGYLAGFSQEENNDAVFLEMTKAYTLNDDGSWDYHEIKKVKLLTYYSFHRLYGETFIVHDPDFQDLKINEAYTIMADGKKVPSPDNAFNFVLPRFAAKAPPYNRLRELVVTHTGLENGAVINLDYTIHTSKDYFPVFMGNVVITERMPVNSLRLIVKIPAKQELQHNTFNIRTAPDVSEENGMKTYVWKFNNLAPMPIESSRPANNILEPRVVFSTAKDLYNSFDLFTDQESFEYAYRDEMKTWASSFFEEDANELTGLIKLQEAVVNDINYWRIPLQYTGFTARPALDTYSGNGGTELEKTILLASLYKSLGYEATLVAAYSTNLFNKSVGDLTGITKFVVQLQTKENGTIYLSAVNKQVNDYKYELSGNTLVVIDPFIESLKTYEIANHESTLAVHGDFEIELDETYVLKGNMKVEISGSINPYFQLVGKQDAIKDLMKPGFSSKNITSFETIALGEDKTEVSYEIEKKNVLKEQENYFFWTIPVSGKGFNANRISYLSEKRESPIQIKQAIKESYNYTLTIPEGLSLVTPTESIVVKNDAGITEIKIERKGNKVTIVRSLHVKQNLYKPVMYVKFKELVDAWINPQFTSLIFKAE